MRGVFLICESILSLAIRLHGCDVWTRLWTILSKTELTGIIKYWELLYTVTTEVKQQLLYSLVLFYYLIKYIDILLCYGMLFKMRWGKSNSPLKKSASNYISNWWLNFSFWQFSPLQVLPGTVWESRLIKGTCMWKTVGLWRDWASWGQPAAFSPSLLSLFSLALTSSPGLFKRTRIRKFLQAILL